MILILKIKHEYVSSTLQTVPHALQGLCVGCKPPTHTDIYWIKLMFYRQMQEEINSSLSTVTKY